MASEGSCRGDWRCGCGVPAVAGPGTLPGRRTGLGGGRVIRRPVLTRPTWDDLAAGISVALVLVPQALAYAHLAGLPPVHGLYAAAVAPIAAALVGSSPYLQTGPVALTSLLT